MATPKIRWTRANRRIGKMVLNTVYTSDCGRFTIEQRWSGARVTGYVLSLLWCRTEMKKHNEYRLLAEAKAAAQHLAKGRS